MKKVARYAHASRYPGLMGDKEINLTGCLRGAVVVPLFKIFPLPLIKGKGSPLGRAKGRVPEGDRVT